MAVWFRTTAVRLAPLSGWPANVVTVTPWLGVQPTLLCTRTLYSYVVNLKGFLKSHIWISFRGNTHNFPFPHKIKDFFSPSTKCTILLPTRYFVCISLPTQKWIIIFGVLKSKVSGKYFIRDTKQRLLFKTNVVCRFLLTVFRSGEDYSSIQDAITNLATCQLSIGIWSWEFHAPLLGNSSIFKYQNLSSPFSSHIYTSFPESHWQTDKPLN